MKKEFLKKLGLKNDVIEQIMSEHRRVSNQAAIEAMVKAAGARAPEVLRILIGATDPEGARLQIAELKGEYPWLFRGACPQFSAPTDGDGETPDPFRYGAGL